MTVAYVVLCQFAWWAIYPYKWLFQTMVYQLALVYWFWSNGLEVRALDSKTRVPVSKALGGSKVDLPFYPSGKDQISTR